MAAALLVPFVAWNSDSFWFGVFRWLREYGPEHQSWFYAKIGFAGPLYEHGHEGWLPYLQSLAVGLPVLGALLAMAPRDNRSFFGFAGSAYVLFIMFNGLIWQSFYLGAFLFVAFVAASAARGPKDRPARIEGAAWRFGAFVFAAAVGVGAWMFVTLVEAERPAGLEETREYLEDELEEGDLLVDQSDWDVAFVDGAQIFADEEHPEGVRIVRNLLGEDSLSPEKLASGSDAPRRLWLVSRGLEHLDDPDQFRRLGRVEADRNFGDMRVIGVSLEPSGARLYDILDRLDAHFEGHDGRSKRLRRHDP
ncbi:MAG: hypothetical protein ACOC3J_06600, partial [Gemmatimonadota bacterium]